jgi:hypothetical protein
MLLTILKLWMACDESAIHICKILRDYNLSISQKLFKSLALSFKSQIKRLLYAEDYLNRRQAYVRFSALRIF